MNGVIDKKIRMEELESYAKGVTYKALKVIATKGNKIAFEILEGKKPEILEDLQQEVVLKILENNLIIKKECFKCVNDYIYNLKKDAVILNIIDEDENSNCLLDQKAYAEYITNYGEYEKTNAFNIEDLGLTVRQLEIINIYSKLNSMGEVARVLGVSKSTVSNIIYRLRDSLQYLQIA